jgi:hypothetical protein
MTQERCLPIERLLRWQARINDLVYISFPDIPIELTDASPALRRGHIAVQWGRIGGDADGAGGVWNGLRPRETTSGGSPVLIIHDLIVIGPVQDHKAAQKSRHNPGMNFVARRTVGVTNVACEEIVVRGGAVAISVGICF